MARSQVSSPNHFGCRPLLQSVYYCEFWHEGYLSEARCVWWRRRFKRKNANLVEKVFY